MVDVDQLLTDFAAMLRVVNEDDWSGPPPDVARRLWLVSSVSAGLRDLASQMELTLVGAMEEDTMNVPGAPPVVRAEERRSAWAFDGASERMREDLVRAVVGRVAVDVATGEIDQGKANVAAEAMRLAYEAIPSFSSLKKSGQRVLGISLSDYRTWRSSYRISFVEGGE